MGTGLLDHLSAICHQDGPGSGGPKRPSEAGFGTGLRVRVRRLTRPCSNVSVAAGAGGPRRFQGLAGLVAVVSRPCRSRRARGAARGRTGNRASPRRRPAHRRAAQAGPAGILVLALAAAGLWSSRRTTAERPCGPLPPAPCAAGPAAVPRPRRPARRSPPARRQTAASRPRACCPASPAAALRLAAAPPRASGAGPGRRALGRPGRMRPRRGAAPGCAPPAPRHAGCPRPPTRRPRPRPDRCLRSGGCAGRGGGLAGRVGLAS
jgi:hypothetical protein